MIVEKKDEHTSTYLTRAVRRGSERDRDREKRRRREQKSIKTFLFLLVVLEKGKKFC